jgi:hypothetical protein
VQTRRLTHREVPDGSIIGVLSDIHIPHHDEVAVRLAIECMERVGVTHVILNGDIADCGPASRHPDKKAVAILDEGCLKESVASGLWIYEWARTRPCFYTLGNHEAWVENYIKKSPELRGTSAESLLGLWENGDGWEVLPSLSRIRLGSRNWEHGDGFFKKGDGGANPGAKMRSKAPDTSDSIGHLHRMFAMYWTSEDGEGVRRTRGKFGNGHLSLPEAHHDYMGTYQNWQTSFEITRVYRVNGKPRFTTSQPEIHRDKRNRPYLEHEGVLYR